MTKRLPMKRIQRKRKELDEENEWHNLEGVAHQEKEQHNKKEGSCTSRKESYIRKVGTSTARKDP